MIGYFYRALASVMSVLYIVLTIGVGSVSQEEPAAAAAESVESAAEQIITLNILQSQPDISRSLQLAADRYVQSRGNSVEIYIQSVADPDYRSTMRSKLLAGESVDLFHIRDLHDVAALESHLADLSGCAWASQSIVPALTVGEETFGLPYSVEGIGLVANRAIFAEAGLSLGDVANYEGLTEVLADLQQAIDAEELRDAYPNLEAVTELPALSTDYLTGTVSELLLADAFISREQAYYSPTLRLPEADSAESFLSMLIRVSVSRYSWREILGTPESRMLDDGIGTERIAVAMTDTQVYRRLYERNPELRGKLQLVPLFFENWEQGVVFTGSPVYWAVNAASSDAVRDEAAAFLEWLYRTEEGAAMLAEDFSLLSPYRESAVDTGIALHQQLLGYMAQGLDQPRVSAEAPSGWGEQALAEQVREYFTVADKEWDDVVSTLLEEWAAARSGDG